MCAVTLAGRPMVTVVSLCLPSEVGSLAAALTVPSDVKHSFAHRFKPILCGSIRLLLFKSVDSLKNKNRGFWPSGPKNVKIF